MQEDGRQADVTVVGSGMAGMAAAIHPARAGFRVLCLEATERSKAAVGESLDWSAPALLADLGLPMQHLIADDFATYKAKVTAKLTDQSSRQYMPGEWLAGPPYNVELRTLHVDRAKLDAAIREIMLDSGVETSRDSVVGVETERRRVTAVTTASGRRICCRWFIDASGFQSSLFPQAFRLRSYDYGPKKVAMWGYFAAADSGDGTTLYMDGAPPYMEWVWEIPIHPNQLSVGYIAAGDAIKEKRERGLSVEQIYRERLATLPRLAELLRAAGSIPLQVTSFQCRVHEGLAGPNWAIVGESASMVDPMTSNGVTAALRHAAEASSLIIRARQRGRMPYLARRMYNSRIVDFGRFFDCGIEKTIYERAVRNRLGILTAGRIYTVPAWVLNAVYSRIEPAGIFSSLLFCLTLKLFRWAAVVLNAACRTFGAREAAA